MNIFNQGIIGLVNPFLHADYTSASPSSETTSSSILTMNLFLTIGLLIIIGGIIAICIYWGNRISNRRKWKYYRDMGFKYWEEERGEYALSHLLYSIDIARRKRLKIANGTDLRIIAHLYLSMNEPELAIHYFDEALKFDLYEGFKNGVIVDLGNLFLLHRRKGDLKRATDFHVEYKKARGTNNSVL